MRADTLYGLLLALAGLMILAAVIRQEIAQGPPLPDCGADWVSRCPGAR